MKGAGKLIIQLTHYGAVHGYTAQSIKGAGGNFDLEMGLTAGPGPRMTRMLVRYIAHNQALRRKGLT